MAAVALGEIAGHRPAEPTRTERPEVPKRDSDESKTHTAARDEVTLSPRGLASSFEGDEVAEGGRPLLTGRTRGFIHKALNAMRRDIGHLLKGLGFGPEAANQFAKAFIEPVVAAIKAGVSFTAELSFASFSQHTEIGATSFSQSTSLVAKSLSIEVNQNTGEVAVSLASLSFEQQIEARFGGEEPLLSLGPGPVEPPPEAESENEASPLEQLLRQVQENLATESVRLETVIAIRLLEFVRNDAGDPIARLVLDAAAPQDAADAQPGVDVDI